MSNKKKPVEKPMAKPVQDLGDGPEKPDRPWTLSIGIYPGILFGLRTYKEKDFTTHVLYLPFLDIALEIDN